jgi:hypothetical protein
LDDGEAATEHPNTPSQCRTARTGIRLNRSGTAELPPYRSTILASVFAPRGGFSPRPRARTSAVKGWQELLVAVALATLLLGSRRIPLLGRGIGRGIFELRRALMNHGLRATAADVQALPAKTEPGVPR